ncbi:MAG TPA: hypothetical protein P5279_12045 [Anaerohalosphaeraceae bacterium]|jgi:uncharacterized repeat protein (TIGR04138 family)|nr:hypothetical protein [Anaerohalosphaeraceae bacterium]HRT51221.1 hypothetical protein [Anaerohalosphaeraceae bacterium]HRT87412.1 hypothetical protein [Anaerohalosphaeraceae bacterium]
MSKKTLEEISREDGRYDAKALKFVFDGLGHTIQQIRSDEGEPSEPRHITGAELAMGIADLAIQRWGRLARMVLNLWGVRTTRDIGEIVYLMIAHKWMTAQESDAIEDFDNVYDFEEVFEKRFQFELQ